LKLGPFAAAINLGYGRRMDTVEYRTAEWVFTATCSQDRNGGHEVRLTGFRLPAGGLMQPFAGKSFRGQSRPEVLATCKKWIEEFAGEIVSTNPDDDE
jgi:hypothetical protein